MRWAVLVANPLKCSSDVILVSEKQLVNMEATDKHWAAVGDKEVGGGGCGG
jgi:hypothetical protein